jgi:alpha-1,6-mannosyltransferase
MSCQLKSIIMSTKIAAVVMLILTLDIGYFVERQDFTHLITAYSGMFVAYFYILTQQNLLQVLNLQQVVVSQNVPKVSNFWNVISLKNLLFFAILLRGVLVFSTPYFIENQLFSETLTPQLFQLLNSKNYFTVYPPVCQAVFAVAVWLFPTSIYGSMVVIKGFLFLCEIGTIYLMFKMLKDKHKVLIYALNPLIIIELCGNVHFEAAMIFFFLLAVYVAGTFVSVHAPATQIPPVRAPATKVAATFAFALSVASKMLPLMFLPFFIRRLGLKKSFLYFTGIGLFLLLMFSPLYNAVFISNIKTSLNLYFEKFEFNASVYYVYSTIEVWRLGFNPILNISKVLISVVLISIILLAIFDKKSKNTDGKSRNNREGGDTDLFSEAFFEKCLFAISVYFLCAAIVHPWYAALPLAISVFTRFRYIMVWTCLLPFTYIHYSYPKPTENFWVIGVEYFIVIGVFILEMLKRDPLSILTKNKDLSET